MSRHVTVRVPSTHLVSGEIAVGSAWLTASFTLDAGRPRLVERGGTLAGDETPAEDDPVFRAAQRACLEAGRDLPAALRIRVVSRILLAADGGHRLAAAAAGALGARALLDLVLDDAAIVRIAAQCDGADIARAAHVVAAHTVVTQPACDD